MNHPLFNNSILKIEDFITIKKYKKQEIIFAENDICNALYLVIKGEISIATYTYFEDTYTIVNLRENSIFGGHILFADSHLFLGNVIALRETIIYSISKVSLLAMFVKDQTILINYLNIIANESLKIQNRIKILSQKSVRDKVMFFLHSEMKKNKTNTIYIKSKEKIAALLNIPRPSLSRELINLRDEGYLDFDRHIITIKRT